MVWPGQGRRAVRLHSLIEVANGPERIALHEERSWVLWVDVEGPGTEGKSR